MVQQKETRMNLVDTLEQLKQYLASRYGRPVYCSVHVEASGYSALHGGPDAVSVNLYDSQDRGKYHFKARTLETAWALMVAHHAALDAVADPVVELPPVSPHGETGITAQDSQR